MKKQIWQQAGRMFRVVGLPMIVGLLAIGCRTTPLPEEATTARPHYTEHPLGIVPESTNGTPIGGGRGLATVISGGNRFTINDMIEVKFSGTIDQNLQTHEENIKEDGTINLPYILSVKAAGKTPGELQKEIHDRYVPEYYKRLTVTVSGAQRVFYVGGQVRQPGRQVYLSTMTVTKAIQSAGDFTDFAAKNRVELTRADGTFMKIDCIKASKEPSLDVAVFPGDKIHVPMRGLSW